jgi:diaminopimelate epimerase
MEVVSLKVEFTKMNGLGNDFIMVDGINNVLPEDLNDFAKKVCDRHFGIGADGVLVILPSKIFDIRMRIINSDGTDAQMCGNGIRCFATYVYEHGLVDQAEMKVETDAGMIRPRLIFGENGVEKVEVDMGLPRLDPTAIPVNVGDPKVIGYPYMSDHGEIELSCVSMGNPHTVTFWKNLADAPFEELGPKLEADPMFPEETNVEFVEILSDKEIRVRVFERGCGETLACGTGACASTVASVLNGYTGRELTVHLSGGDLLCRWDENDHVIMTGPVSYVAKGVYEYNE